MTHNSKEKLEVSFMLNITFHNFNVLFSCCTENFVQIQSQP